MEAEEDRDQAGRARHPAAVTSSIVRRLYLGSQMDRKPHIKAGAALSPLTCARQRNKSVCSGGAPEEARSSGRRARTRMKDFSVKAADAWTVTYERNPVRVLQGDRGSLS
jgi:hypothetical protein